MSTTEEDKTLEATAMAAIGAKEGMDEELDQLGENPAAFEGALLVGEVMRQLLTLCIQDVGEHEGNPVEAANAMFLLVTLLTGVVQSIFNHPGSRAVMERRCGG